MTRARSVHQRKQGAGRRVLDLSHMVPERRDHEVAVRGLKTGQRAGHRTFAGNSDERPLLGRDLNDLIGEQTKNMFRKIGIFGRGVERNSERESRGERDQKRR